MGIVSVIIRLAILIQYQPVTDRETQISTLIHLDYVDNTPMYCSIDTVGWAAGRASSL